MADKKKKTKTGKDQLTKSGGYLYPLLVFATVFILYANTIGNSYNLDDELVTNNQAVASKGWAAVLPNVQVFSAEQYKDSSLGSKLFYFLPEVLRTPYYSDAMGYSYDYRPVVIGSFAVEHAIFGDNAGISHLFNVIIYAFCCLLFFFLFKKLLPLPEVAVFAMALLFAAYPPHTEAVASIKNRDELLGLTFSFLSWLFLLSAFEGKRVRSSYLLAFLFFLLAVLSKQNYTLFALIIPCGTALFRKSKFWRLFIASIIYAIPFFAFYSAQTMDFKFKLTGLILVTPIMVSLASGLSTSGFGTLIKDFFTYNPFKEIKTEEDTILPVKQASGYFSFTKTNIAGIREIVSHNHKELTISIVLSFTVWATHFLSQSIFLVAVAVATALYLFSKNNLKQWLGIGLGMLYLYIFSWHLETPGIKLLIFVFLAFSFFRWENKVVRLLYFLTIACYLFLSPFSTLNFSVFFIIIALLGTIPVWVLALLVEAAIIVYVRIKGLQFPSGAIISIILMNVVLLILKLKNYRFRLAAITTFAALGMLLPISIMSVIITKPAVPTQTAYQKPVIGKTESLISNPINLIGAHQDRPLDFLEFPLNPGTRPSDKIGISGTALWHYYKLSLVPYPLAFYYGYRYFDNVPATNPFSMLGWLITGSLILLGLLFFSKHKILSFGLLLYVFSLIPFSNLLQPIAGIAADRYLLIPSIGFVVAITYLILYLFNQVAETKLSSPKKLMWYALAGIGGIYSVLTVARNFNWYDDLTLFRHDIKVVDQSAQAHSLLAIHLMAKSLNQNNQSLQIPLRNEAIYHFHRALEIYPQFFNAQYNLGRAFAAIGAPDSAIAALKLALQMDSTYDDIYNYLGQIYYRTGRYYQALPYFEKLITMRPYDEASYNMLDSAYRKTGNYLKSVDVYIKEYQYMPQNSKALGNIGDVLYDNGKLQEAEPYFKQLIEKWPDDYNSYDKLSFLYFKMGKINQSISVNLQAANRMPKNPLPFANIGTVYRISGKADSAKIYYQKALEINPDNQVAKAGMEAINGRNK